MVMSAQWTYKQCWTIIDIRVNYSNAYAYSPNGPDVIYLSEPFYVTAPDQPDPSCQATCFGIGPSAVCKSSASLSKQPAVMGLLVATGIALGMISL